MNATPPEPRIRKAALEDLDDILAIEAVWPTTPHWTRTHFEAELASDRACFCVLEGGGRIMGYASMKLIPPEAQVFNVAVRPDLARSGWGRKLMAYLRREAIRAGCTKMTLEVSEKNAAALGLYAGAGFRIVGGRPKYYNDGSSALLMEALI